MHASSPGLGKSSATRRDSVRVVGSAAQRPSRPNGDRSPTTSEAWKAKVLTVIEPPSNRSIAMVLNTESKYPNRRAYVLKLRGEACPVILSGRLENLVTGRQVEFASARELLEFIAADLVASAVERPADAAE